MFAGDAGERFRGGGGGVGSLHLGDIGGSGAGGVVGGAFLAGLAAGHALDQFVDGGGGGGFGVSLALRAHRAGGGGGRGGRFWV